MNVAAISTYIGQFFSGEIDPSLPHLVLILAAVVGGAAVGGGIIWEAARGGHLYTWPTVLVFFGVIIEAAATVILFEFDESISRKQQSTIEAQASVIRSQNEKIIALEERIAPRDLMPEQQARIAEAIKSFAPMQFDLAMQQDLEPMALLDKIEDALLLASWQEVPADTRGPTFDRGNKSKVAIRTVAGVWVGYAKTSDEKYGKAAKALSEALHAEKIKGPLIVFGKPDPEDLGKIHVWVGVKPIAE